MPQIMKKILQKLLVCCFSLIVITVSAQTKQIPAYTVPPVFTATVGIPLSRIYLPVGFSWQTPATFTSLTPGTVTVSARFTPGDTQNYQIIENVEISINYIDEPAWQKPTHDIVFLMDDSGSLSTAAYMQEKQAIAALCDALVIDPYVEYRIAIVKFNSSAQIVVPLTKLASTTYPTLRNTILNLSKQSGNTATPDAIFIGYELLKTLPVADFQSIFLLTDGESNVAGAISRNYGYSNASAARTAAIEKLKRETNATAYSIGFGASSLNELRQFATDPSKVYTAANASGLADIVTSVADNFFANDYSLIGTYMARIPADLSVYTQSSVAAVNNAISQVIYGDKISQDLIDSWAAQLLAAINNLTLIKHSVLVITCADINAGEIPNPIVVTNQSGSAVTFSYALRGSSNFITTAPSTAGEYTVKAVSAATDTYYEAEAFADFSVIQREITIDWSNTTLTYNGNEQAPTATITIGEEIIPLTVSGGQTNAGKDYIAAASLDAEYQTLLNNYVLLNESTTFEIEAIKLSIYAVDEIIIYGQTPVLTYSHYSGKLLNGDRLRGELNVSHNCDSDKLCVGTHTIRQGSLSAGNNYRISFVDGILVVQQPQNSYLHAVASEEVAFVPSFNPEITDYKILMPCNKQVITIDFSTQSSLAIMNIDGNNVGQSFSKKIQITNPEQRTFTVTVNDRDEEKTYTFTVIKPFENVVLPVFNDVLSVINEPKNNGGYTFTDYQWYNDKKLTSPMPGETEGNLYLSGESNENQNYTVWLTTSEGVSSFGCRKVNSNLCTASVKTYPNPIIDNVYVQNDEWQENTYVELYDMTGKLLLKQAIHSALTELNMSNVKQGAYVLKANGQTITIVKK